MVVSMNRWVGKVAVVTGASAGIGAAIAVQLVEEGLTVVGLARRVEKVQELAKQLEGKNGKLHALKADVSVENDLLAAFKWVKDNLGPVHILVNNAGIILKNSLIDGDTQKWRNILDVNVMGLCICTREAIKSMKENNIDGHIIHINSIAGHSVPNFPGVNIYSASKHAVTALTETLRHEINQNKLKIKITSVSPGVVLTEIITAGGLDKDEDTKKMMESTPMLKSEDVADAVIYALSTPPHVQVVGLARRIERLQELVKKLEGKKGKLYPFKTDVAVESDILTAFKWIKDNLGPVHILVNNAGICSANSLIDGDTEKWRNIFDVNVMGLCISTREAIKCMKENNIDGHIIHINSVAGHRVPSFSGMSVYPASKHAVTALTETLRHEINQNKLKIKITSVSPGAVATEIFEVSGIQTDKEMKKVLESIPMLKSEDVSDAVVFALSTPAHVQLHEITIKPMGELF